MKQQLWYNTVEPNFQIQLLKEIAFKEHSLTSLKTKFKKSKTLESTIDISISKLKTNYELIQFSREEIRTEGKRPQKIIGLTKKGIIVLVGNHYADNKQNRKNKIVGEPYLTTTELGMLLFNIFENKYSSYNNKEEKLNEWENPIQNNDFTKNDIIRLYEKANPNKLVDEFKEKSKLKKILDKIDSLQDEMTETLYESMVFDSKK